MISRFLTFSVLALLSADAFAGQDCSKLYEGKDLSCNRQKCWFSREIPMYITAACDESKAFAEKTMTLVDRLRGTDWQGLRNQQDAAKRTADGASVGGCPNCQSCIELARERENTLKTLIDDGHRLLQEASGQDACGGIRNSCQSSGLAGPLRDRVNKCKSKLTEFNTKVTLTRTAVQSAVADADNTGDCTAGANTAARNAFNSLANDLAERHRAQWAVLEKNICEPATNCNAAIVAATGTRIYAAVQAIARTSALDRVEAGIMNGVRAFDTSKAAPLPPTDFADYVNRIVGNRHTIAIEMLGVKDSWPMQCRN